MIVAIPTTDLIMGEGVLPGNEAATGSPLGPVTHTLALTLALNLRTAASSAAAGNPPFAISAATAA
jgi:hypothetical protein